jgi:hypothetical protein
MAMSDERGLGLPEPDPSQARVEGRGAMGEQREASRAESLGG